MNPRSALRLAVIAVAAATLSLTASAQRTDAPQLFFDAPVAGAAPAPDRAATRSRVVQLRTDLLTAADRQPQLILSLFPDAVFRAAFQSLEVIRPGQTVWRASLAGIEDGEATLAITDGAVAGQVTMPGAQYGIRYLGAGLHVVEQLDTSRLPREGDPLVPDPSLLAEPEVVPGQVPDDGSIIDVMVVFTPAARAAAGGTAGMTSVVNVAVANTNNSYANSGVTQRLRLVYSGEVSYSENTLDMNTDLSRLTNTADGFIDEVHTLRNTYRADFVALLTTGQDSCGLGWVMQTVSTSFQTNAFNVTAWNCAGANLSFAHELGHNMGLQHDFANAGFQGAYSYAYGHQDPGFFRTVMAYPCSGPSCPRVQHFSTHTRTFGGRPTGVANASENVRALNNTAPTTANFRVGVVCTFTVSPGTGNAPISGGTGTVLVTASDSTCAWNAASNAAFISVSPTSGVGSGAVNYTVAPYGGGNTRSGTLTIAGQTFTVYQAGFNRRLTTDFNADGIEEVGIFRPLQGRFYVDGRPSVDWGVKGDLPVPGDYNGDRVAEYAVWRPSTRTWYVMGGATVVWGAEGAIPVPGDYNGDGVTDLAVFRPSTMEWFVRNVGTFSWGGSGDLPVVGDWDGDGDTDIAVWRPATGTWYIRNGPTVAWGAPGDIPVPGDYDGNGTTDIAVWRPSTGTWYVKDQLTRVWGALGDIPVPLDRNGDGRAELGVVRASTNSWYLLNTVTAAIETIGNGATADIPLGRQLPAVHSRWGDYDGDRRADLTVFRPSNGNWVSLRSMTGMTDYTVRSFGLNGDVPVAGDWDGDGINDPAVYRPSTQTWYAQRSSTNYTDYISRTWGLSGDIAVPADYDGDRKMDFAVFRPSLGRWVILLSSTGNTSYILHDFGLNGDIPVPGDYDGDMRADIAVFRPSTGRWYILDRFTGAYITFDWGLVGDSPVPGDYDGDGKFDIAVFRPSTGRWVILLSSTGFTAYVFYDFGLSTDTTVPADYDGDGRTDIAVFRPSTGRWYILNRFLGTYIFRDWGLSGDLPATKLPF